MRQEQETAKIIASVLDKGASSLDRGTLDQLAAARNKALAAMPAQVAEEEPVFAGAGKYLSLHLHGQRIWAPMLALLGAALVAFILLHSAASREPMEADAMLLASDLPPEAYLDKGFDAWLEQSSRH